MTIPRMPMRGARWMVVALAVGTALVGAVWFFTLGPLIFMGDDLATADYFQHGGLLLSLPAAGGGKYRPVADLAWAAATALFGRNFTIYVAVNVLIEVANTLLFARIAWLLTRGRSRALVAAAALAFLLCRFTYQYVVQVIGLMEVIALGLFLLVVHDAVIALTRRNEAALWRTLLWYLLVVYTHERYLLLAPFLVAVGVAYRGFSWKDGRRFAYVALVAAIAVSNFVLKQYVLKANFFTGTAGKTTRLDSGTLDQFWAGLLNVLGFSRGPDYLVGITWADAWPVGFALGAAFSALVVLTAARGATLLRGPRARDAVVAALLFLSLFVPLLVSASVASLQDLRWLYAPYAALVLALVAVAAASLLSTAALRAWTAGFLVISLATGAYYRGPAHHLYFVYEMQFASNLKHAIIDQAYERRPTIILTHGVSEYRWWGLQSGLFFDFYAGRDPVTVDFAATPADAQALLRALPNARVLDVNDPLVSDATAQVLADEFAAIPHRVPLPVTAGRLVNGATSQEAAPAPVALAFGSAPVTAVVVPPGDTLLLSGVKADRAHALSLFVTNASRVRPTRAVVSVSRSNDTVPVFDETLAPSRATAWQKVLIPLGPYGGAPVTVRIAVDAAAAGAPGIAVAAPTIVPQ